MCNGFGGIITQDGRVLFAEPDESGDCSHSELLNRLGMKDNKNEFVRSFVRFEFPKWTEASFRYDEDDTLPVWVTPEFEDRAKAILRRIAPARAEYQNVRNAAQAEYQKVHAPAWAEYQKVHAPAWAEYEKVRDAARAEYEKVRDAARAEYQKVHAPAWAEYEKVHAPARAEYEKVNAPAWAEYEKVRDAAWAEFICTISTIQGYTPVKN
jgi:L-rhamnose mutarotase